MVKAPSSHGLDRKYKSWRRGKSQNSKRRSSLKQQLRGHERLLQRATDENHRRDLLQKIQQLQQEIDSKQKMERERQNAKKSHGARFLERQKLVRMERNVHKNSNLSSAQKERELTKIALDQVYVAHYPMDYAKYLPLFYQGVRRVDHRRLLTRRAQIRTRVLSLLLLLPEQEQETKSWISAQQYERARSVKKEWSVEQEVAWFGEASSSSAAAATQDERFAVPTQQHEALLAAAERMEAELDQGEEANSKGDNDSRSSISDEDDADPLKPQSKAPVKGRSLPEAEKQRSEGNASTSSDDSSVTSSSESSSSSSSGGGTRRNEAQDSKAATNTKSCGSVDNKNNPLNGNDDNMEDDDFFAPATDSPEGKIIFDNPKERMSASDPFKGDKSKGWATQRQRPGQFRNHQRKKTWR